MSLATPMTRVGMSRRGDRPRIRSAGGRDDGGFGGDESEPEPASASASASAPVPDARVGGSVGRGIGAGGEGVLPSGTAGLGGGLVLVAEVEEVHGLADVEQAVGVVGEAPLLAGVVEIGLDEEVRAQGRGLARIGPPAAEALLPLGPGPIGDGGDLAGELHAGVGRHAAVVEAAVPVGVHHEDLTLRVAHGDAVGVAPGAAADGGDARDSIRVEGGGGEGLHASHAGADAGVEARDAQVVQQAELRADHVLHGEDGEARGVHLAVAGVDAAGARRAVAPANDVGADDVEAVRVQRGSGADEPLPPTGSGIGLGGAGVRGGREAGVQEDHVGPVGVGLAPRLVGDVERGQHAAPVEQKGLAAVDEDDPGPDPGPGPEREPAALSRAERDSIASRQGKARAGLEGAAAPEERPANERKRRDGEARAWDDDDDDEDEPEAAASLPEQHRVLSHHQRQQHLLVLGDLGVDGVL
ncbi:hypothetical protein Trco_007847 [Trichoderma cornu-damae]|uniref:Uncharacterized protein n=1 Tax=Trichoderma cornu-damae TaxID=654480 RepID=A0A9P8TRQ1_9HYPO|nr:hypothetical protein Trco_007847 [Trichoderma cornu-damae]